MGVDPTPAPRGDVSIGSAIEAFTGARFGSSGTLTAARIITACSQGRARQQIGYSGLMVPVMEDKHLAQRWAESAYDIDQRPRLLLGLRNRPRHHPSTRRRHPRPDEPHLLRRSLARRQVEQAPLRAPPTHPRQKARRPHRIRQPIPLQHHHPPPLP